MVESILKIIEQIGSWAYFVVFLMAFFESVAFVGSIVPGLSIILFSGFLVSLGVLDFYLLIWAVAIGAFLGDSLSYFLGRRGEEYFRRKSLFFDEKNTGYGEDFFCRYGESSIFIGRFVGLVRGIVPFVAGVYRMKLASFLLWDISSAFLWAILNIYLGYFFGHAWDRIEVWTNRVVLFFIIFLAVLFSLWQLIRSNQSVKERLANDAETKRKNKKRCHKQ